MTEKHIEAIIALFHQAKVWNNGVFINLVNKYCIENQLNVESVNNQLEKAFIDYLATNIKSENAISFRLKQLKDT